MAFKVFKSIIYFISFLPVRGVHAQDSVQKIMKSNLHFQTTYIYQVKPSFLSPYEGKNSLLGKREEQNSITATLFFGARLWKGGELYLNPELAGGSGLSGASGMAGSSNGETVRVGNSSPTLYKARYYIKQTFSFGLSKEWQEEEANKLGGYIFNNRLCLYIGKFSLGDLFDNNEYSNSPRTQFINWALMNNGAWDYAANVRGYTYSIAMERVVHDWTYKIAFSTLPKEANGDKLNTNFKDSFAIAVNVQVDRTYKINHKTGHFRILGYRNEANMGNYLDAIYSMPVPDIIATRKLGRTKWGWGINADQELGKNAGLFARMSWNDGKNETWAFTEIERTFSLGLSLKGDNWDRKNDHAGIAVVANGLSNDHKEYLAKGGVGFMLGDGALNYGPEGILEFYYNLKPANVPLWFTGDYQLVFDPGYNKDRGPVNIFSIRMHLEF